MGRTVLPDIPSNKSCLRGSSGQELKEPLKASLGDGNVFFLSGVLFGMMCTSMAVAASLMGSVVQVIKEGKDTFDFIASFYPFSFLMLFLQATL